jgi:hypothetical protein
MLFMLFSIFVKKLEDFFKEKNTMLEVSIRRCETKSFGPHHKASLALPWIMQQARKLRIGHGTNPFHRLVQASSVYFLASRLSNSKL